MSEKTEHPFAAFSKALEVAGLAKGSEKIKIGERIVAADARKEENTVETVSKPPVARPTARRAAAIRLPRVLVEEAARTVYTHFEAIAAKDQGVEPLPWDALGNGYRDEWRYIIAIVLEMGISLVLKDAIQVLDESNGDLGGAFVKGLRRYMKDYLNVE